jgi:hypothetical protein
MPIFGDIDKKHYTDLLKDNVSARIKTKSEPQPLLEAEDVEDIEVENPGILEVPEGKDVEDLPESHFQSLIKKKGWEEISRALVNLIRWNKNKNKSLSNWADSMQEKLSKWVDKQREEKDDPDLYA